MSEPSHTLDSEPAGATLAQIQAVNGQAAFNRWAGIVVTEVAPGVATIELPWKAELGQYAGFLHAGLIGALIDTACGFAAATVAGRVLASHFSVNCFAPAVGERFRARAVVIKAGKRQIFTSAELFARKGSEEKLVADGQTILMRVTE